MMAMARHSSSQVVPQRTRRPGRQFNIANWKLEMLWEKSPTINFYGPFSIAATSEMIKGYIYDSVQNWRNLFIHVSADDEFGWVSKLGFVFVSSKQIDHEFNPGVCLPTWIYGL